MTNHVSKLGRTSSDTRDFLEEGTAPGDLRCPISWDLMRRPVRVVNAGPQRFEEDAIVDWLSNSSSPKHPLTQEALPRPMLERSASMHQALTAFRTATADAAEALGKGDVAEQMRREIATLHEAQTRPPASIPLPTPQRRAWLQSCRHARAIGDRAAEFAAEGRKTAASAERVARRGEMEGTAVVAANLAMPRLPFALDVDALHAVLPPALVTQARACVDAPTADGIFDLVDAAEAAGTPPAALFAAGEGTLALALLAAGEHAAIEAAHQFTGPVVYEDFIFGTALSHGLDADNGNYFTGWMSTGLEATSARHFTNNFGRLTLSDFDADGKLARTLAVDVATLSPTIAAVRDQRGLSGMLIFPTAVYLGRLNDRLQPHGFGKRYHPDENRHDAGVFRDNLFRHGVRLCDDGRVDRVAMSTRIGGLGWLGTQEHEGGAYAGTLDAFSGLRAGFGVLSFTENQQPASVSGQWSQSYLQGPGLHRVGDTCLPGAFFVLRDGQEGTRHGQAFSAYTEPAPPAAADR